MKFNEFPKIARLNREIIISEKLDGTNAQIFIANKSDAFGEGITGEFKGHQEYILAENETYLMFAGSRTKWITPGKQTDNYGFAQWVKDNSEELFKLGEGQHFGEWWGNGIQRNYGCPEKRFSLFNIGKWSDDLIRPKCCYVVPKLYEGLFDTNKIKEVLEDLRQHGSYAIPFMNPEGIVIFHTASRELYKITLKDDEKPKSLS